MPLPVCLLHLPEHSQGEWFWTLANLRTHHALVTERHWTTDEYERWLGHLLARALLAEPSM
jgi:transposase